MLLGVCLGAFAAHGLKSEFSPEMLGVFQTGVKYQMYHSIALLVVAILAHKGNLFRYAGMFYIGGIIFFSFSLYVLALTGIIWVAYLTPFGGVSFLVGHLFLLLGFLKG